MIEPYTIPAWLTAEQACLLTRAAEILEAEHHVCEAQVVRMVAYALPAPLASEHVEALRDVWLSIEVAEGDDEPVCVLSDALRQRFSDALLALGVKT